MNRLSKFAVALGVVLSEFQVWSLRAAGQGEIIFRLRDDNQGFFRSMWSCFDRPTRLESSDTHRTQRYRVEVTGVGFFGNYCRIIKS